MKTYRPRKTVQAEQWNGKSGHLGVSWVPEELDQDGSRYGGFYSIDGTVHGRVRTGWWVILHPNGKRGTLSDEAFRRHYEEVGPQVIIAENVGTINM